MNMLLVTTWFGSFLMDGKQVISSRPFPKDVKEIAERLRKIDRGEVLDEERQLAAEGRDIEVFDDRLRALGRFSDGRAPALDQMMGKLGFQPSLLHEATMLVGQQKLGELGPDRFIVQAMAGLEELTKTSNLLIERLTEWYGMHYPELVETAAQKELVNLVAEHGGREAISRAQGKALESFGTPLSEEDEKALRSWAVLARTVNQTRDGIESYITKRMEELAPNLSSAVGPLLGARLISLTGSLERLGRLPASTIQLLGAEKALFQFMKEGGRPPKHGVLFQHPLIHRAPPWQRGKIARALSSAAALAARADFYSKQDRSGFIKAALQKKLERIQKEHAAPPERRSGKIRERARRIGPRRS
jgi:nucleolar protein 56